jgi:hypothetical protein
MGGSNTSGVYGQLGVAALSNRPGARNPAVGWYDSATRELWMFGGYGYVSTSTGTFKHRGVCSIIIILCMHYFGVFL